MYKEASIQVPGKLRYKGHISLRLLHCGGIAEKVVLHFQEMFFLTFLPGSFSFFFKFVYLILIIIVGIFIIQY